MTNSTRFPSVLICVYLWMNLTGCENANPLSRNDYYLEIAREGAVEMIDAKDFASSSRTPPVSVEEATTAMRRDWSPQSMVRPGEPVSLSLAEARAAALAGNLDLQVALYDPAIAQESINEEEARFEWVFTASARRTHVDAATASTLANSQALIDEFDFGVNIPLRTGGTVNVNLPVNRTETNNAFATLNPSFSTDLRFSISQPLLRNAGVRPNTHGIRVAKYQKRLTDALTKLEAIRVLANVDRAYWNLYAARQSLDVALKQYELAVAQLERARRRVAQETAPRIEVTRAESGVAQRLEAIIVAQNAVKQRERDLKRLMNRTDLPVNDQQAVLPTTEPNPLGLQLDAGELAAFAIDNRMEMLEQELRLAINASTIDFQRNQALPLVVLDYSYTVNGLGGNLGNSFDLMASKRFEDWSAGLRAEIPIGNEAANARINRAILERLQRLATREQRRQAIETEVRNAVDTFDTNWQRVLAARQAAILAGEVLLGEQRQYDAGARTSTDVLDAAAALADAQNAEIRALVDYQIAQVDLAFATGTLLGQGQVRWEAKGLEE